MLENLFYYIGIYIGIGVAFSVGSWLFYTSKWSKRKIDEGIVVAYLPVCTVLWPLLILLNIYVWIKSFLNN